MAIVCWSSKFRPLLVMWAHPRMLAWLVVSLILVVTPRLVFSGADVVPRVIPYDPGVAFVPLCAIFFGPAGVWGAALASLLGDLLTGTWGALPVFRAIGWFLAAWWFSQLGRPLRDTERRSPLKFLQISILAAITAAAWNALGTETARLYPFSYTFMIALLHHLVFLSGFGLALHFLMAGGMSQRVAASWEELIEFKERVQPPFSTMLLIMVAASLGLCVIVWLISTLVYGYHPLHPVPLGGHLGAWMEALAIPCMLIQIVAIFWPDIQLPPEEDGQLGDREYAWRGLIKG